MYQVSSTVQSRRKSNIGNGGVNEEMGKGMNVLIKELHATHSYMLPIRSSQSVWLVVLNILFEVLNHLLRTHICVPYTLYTEYQAKKKITQWLKQSHWL